MSGGNRFSRNATVQIPCTMATVQVNTSNNSKNKEEENKQEKP